MPRIKPTINIKLENEQSIYIILDENTREFYIGKTAPKNLRSTYHNHYNLKNKKTKINFELGKKNNKPPAMYLIETIEIVKISPYNRQLIWTKFFIEKGYKALDKTITPYINILDKEVISQYEEIKDLEVNSILSKENKLFEEYGEIRKRNKISERSQINFKVTQQEYEQIHKFAQENKKSVAAYCREMALNKSIILFDYQSIREHTKEISELRSTINNIVDAVMNSGEFYQIDMDNIFALIEKINESESKFLIQMSKDREKKAKEFKKFLAENYLSKGR